MMQANTPEPNKSHGGLFVPTEMSVGYIRLRLNKMISDGHLPYPNNDPQPASLNLSYLT